MTPEGSRNRLLLYVAIAMLGAAQNGTSVDFGLNWETVSYALAILSAGLVTARSYVDKSPSEVQEPQPDPEPEPKPYQTVKL